MGLGQPLIVPHHGAQEAQAFGDGHEGDKYLIACSVKLGDQGFYVFRMAARRLEEYIDLALDGPFAC